MAQMSLDVKDRLVKLIAADPAVFRVSDTGEYRCGYRVHADYPCGSQPSSVLHTPAASCPCDRQDEHHAFEMYGGTMVLEIEFK